FVTYTLSTASYPLSLHDALPIFSLVLNLFEKLVERRVLRKIRELQQKIDFLYPRLPAEHSLVQIAAATDESKEALQELHERIGEDRKSTRLNSSHVKISYAVFCL